MNEFMPVTLLRNDSVLASNNTRNDSEKVDALYFESCLNQCIRDIDLYTPRELARTLARLAVLADAGILIESEFRLNGVETV